MTSPSYPQRGTLEGGYWILRQASAYSAEQATRWLECIGFPQLFTAQDIRQGKFPTTLENLEMIIRLYLVTFIYENTQMHYSAHHSMDISPEGIYNRMVVERNGGSYCFGLNTLLFQMLRVLHYRAYTGAARINIEKDSLLPPKFTAPLHMVIFVQLYKDSNVTYLVDVGCGGSGPTRPILLSDAGDNIVVGTSPSEKHHLTKGAHPKTSLAVQSHNEFNTVCTDWQLEVLHENMDSMTPASWRIIYSFSEKEWFPADFDSANLAVCAMQSGLFWENVLCSKHFWLESDNFPQGYNSPLAPWQRHLGRLAMDRSSVRRHVGSRSEVLRTFTTERERILALRELFDVHILGDDIRHILGRAAALSET